MTKSNDIPASLGQVQPTKLAIRLFFYSYSGGGLQWFAAVICLLFIVFTAYRPKLWWWFVVVCGGLWWFVMVCGGLSSYNIVIPYPRQVFSLALTNRQILGCIIWLLQSQLVNQYHLQHIFMIKFPTSYF